MVVELGMPVRLLDSTDAFDGFAGGFEEFLELCHVGLLSLGCDEEEVSLGVESFEEGLGLGTGAHGQSASLGGDYCRGVRRSGYTPAQQHARRLLSRYRRI